MRAAILVFVVGCGGGRSPMPGDIDAPVVIVDAAIDAVDAAGFTCANDSTLEPNDTIANAFITPVDTNPMVNFTSLAICPTATDKDHYGINLSGVKGIEVTASWTSGSAVQVSLLNAAGTSIVNGTVGAMSTRACAPNLPAGTYYAAVFASAINNYSLSIKTVTSCN